MRTLEQSRTRFAEIVDTLTDVVVQPGHLDAGLLVRTAARESRNLAELEQELRAMRTSLPNGLEVCTPDYEALAGFAVANGLDLAVLEGGIMVDERSRRVVFLEYTNEKIAIRDVEALSGLTSLEDLRLDRNEIHDISALSGLTSLKKLYLSQNRIGDISSFSSLTSLKELDLNDNQIADISALSDLTSLNQLFLFGNGIQDISALAGLTSLSFLMIETPILDRAGAINFNDQIAALKNRGVKVKLKGLVGSHAFLFSQK